MIYLLADLHGDFRIFTKSVRKQSEYQLTENDCVIILGDVGLGLPDNTARYPHGTIVELTAPIEDPYGSSKPIGARFKVDFVDDMNQLQGRWLPPERGSIAILIEEDSFKIVN